MSLGSDQRGGVDFWRYAQHEFAGSGLFGCLALLFTYGYVVVDCRMKIGGQLGYGLAVESDDVPHAEYTPNEYIVARIEFDPCGIAFVARARAQ